MTGSSSICISGDEEPSRSLSRFRPGSIEENATTNKKKEDEDRIKDAVITKKR